MHTKHAQKCSNAAAMCATNVVVDVDGFGREFHRVLFFALGAFNVDDPCLLSFICTFRGYAHTYYILVLTRFTHALACSHPFTCLAPTRNLPHPPHPPPPAPPPRAHQACSIVSEKAYRPGQQSDPIQFLSWFLNTLHRELGGTKKKDSSCVVVIVWIVCDLLLEDFLCGEMCCICQYVQRICLRRV